MAKATTNRVIAFDLDEALSFEGDTGPYLQYSLVRVKSILRKLAGSGLPDAVTPAEAAALPDELFEDDLWDLVLAVAQVGELAERAADSLELSLVARGALEIAQRFSAVYHRHPIAGEADPQRRAARLAAVLAFQRGLATLCDLLGIPVPDKM
jgi:arginyl-tRNA synthetase